MSRSFKEYLCKEWSTTAGINYGEYRWVCLNLKGRTGENSKISVCDCQWHDNVALMIGSLRYVGLYNTWIYLGRGLEVYGLHGEPTIYQKKENKYLYFCNYY